MEQKINNKTALYYTTLKITTYILNLLIRNDLFKLASRLVMFRQNYLSPKLRKSVVDSRINELWYKALEGFQPWEDSETRKKQDRNRLIIMNEENIFDKGEKPYTLTWGQAVDEMRSENENDESKADKHKMDK
tara:strand:- start:682 stop:1080 length:399 start_codon:yes stop_codon:yes gene_type:complete